MGRIGARADRRDALEGHGPGDGQPLVGEERDLHHARLVEDAIVARELTTPLEMARQVARLGADAHRKATKEVSGRERVPRRGLLEGEPRAPLPGRRHELRSDAKLLPEPCGIAHLVEGVRAMARGAAARRRVRPRVLAERRLHEARILVRGRARERELVTARAARAPGERRAPDHRVRSRCPARPARPREHAPGRRDMARDARHAELGGDRRGGGIGLRRVAAATEVRRLERERRLERSVVVRAPVHRARPRRGLIGVTADAGGVERDRGLDPGSVGRRHGDRRWRRRRPPRGPRARRYEDEDQPEPRQPLQSTRALLAHAGLPAVLVVTTPLERRPAMVDAVLRPPVEGAPARLARSTDGREGRSAGLIVRLLRRLRRGDRRSQVRLRGRSLPGAARDGEHEDEWPAAIETHASGNDLA